MNARNLTHAFVTFLVLTLSAQTVLAQAADRPSTGATELVVVAHGRPDRAARVFAGIGLGLGGLVVATGIGLGAGMAMPRDCSSSSLFCFQNHAFEGLFIGAGIGAALFPALYTLASEITGGRGNAGGAYLGFLIGGAASAGTIALGIMANDNLRNDAGGVVLGTSLVLGVLLPIAGTAIGYELTDLAASPVRPTVSVDQHGATLGIDGTF